jgi:hypothetical protein
MKGRRPGIRNEREQAKALVPEAGVCFRSRNSSPALTSDGCGLFLHSSEVPVVVCHRLFLPAQLGACLPEGTQLRKQRRRETNMMHAFEGVPQVASYVVDGVVATLGE